MEIQNMSEEEWEVLDYYCYGEEEEDGYGYGYGEEEEKQKWWKVGNWVKEAGKKLVMTGIVVSSAPVVLPPLLVVSALGLAMSFPFGVVFASYACTHKLITKLLPPPQHGQESNIIPQQEEEEMSEDMKKESEIRIDLVEDEINDLQVGGEKNDTSTRKKLEEESETDDAKVAPESSTSSSSSSSSSSENQNGSIKIDEEITKDEELDNEKIEQQTVSKNADATTLDKQQNKTPHQPPSDLDPDHKEEVSLSEARKVGEDSENRVVVNGDSDKESEAKIWEKINAIRVIVGFKAPRRSSYLEEVKALYLFTGIDPPSPSPFTSVSELDNNLSFLMSVIGLK